MAAGIVCPVDGVRLLLVSSTNGAGDDIKRWECPTGDWCGPYFSGGAENEDLHIPELSRATSNISPACGSLSVTLSSGTSSDSATVTEIAATVTPTTLAAANPNRYALIIFNDSTAALHIKFGSGVTTSDHTIRIPGSGTFEMHPPIAYTGLITGVWEAANGHGHVTEIS